MKYKPFLILLVMSACDGYFPAWAEEISTSMPVSVRVLPVASVTVTHMFFGSFTRDMTTVRGRAAVTVSLAPGLPYFIAISAGMHYADGWRNVENSGFMARYVLSQESGAEWGDGDFVGSYPQGGSVGGRGAGSAQYYNVRGELLVSSLAANAPIGAYQDVLLVTVYY